MSEVLAPARDEVAGILERGQRDGVFHDRLPAAVLSSALAALTVSLLESVNTGAREDDGTRTAVATPVAAGVPEKESSAAVEAEASEAPEAPEPRTAASDS